jgi:Ca-activated chloride channel family protein
MRTTALIFSLALASLAVLLLPRFRAPKEPLRLATQLDRRFFPNEGGDAYLQIDVAAQGSSVQRMPVNAVLILDCSGSMEGAKFESAREAARALARALSASDRLGIVAFSSSAHVALLARAMDARGLSAALAAIDDLTVSGGTNLSDAFDLASAQVARGRAAGRVDKVFLASDGQANEGISDRSALLQLAAREFGDATLSTFGLGDDYDETFMNALAAQRGGRSRYIASPEVLPRAIRDELSRASAVAARNVRLRVSGLSGAQVARILGYEVVDGWARLPDFAAGEERRVMVKLSLSPGQGELPLAEAELRFDDARGETVDLRATARAVLTADALRLAEAPGPAAALGAKAEMAVLAGEAARLRESGIDDGAELRALRQVAARSPAVAADAESYERDVQAVGRGGGAASKKLKEKVFDAARAPVAGW